MKSLQKVTLALTSFFLLTITAFAYSGDISINQQDITFSTSNFLEGNPVRIYSTIVNHSNQDLLGIVRYTDNGKQIGADQAISIFKGSTDGVFVDWIPAYGQHEIAVKIYPWTPEIDDPNNNWIVAEVFVVQDTDYDGIPNDKDEDDDGDGVTDSDDDFPLNPKEQYDTDGDGTGNNADLDDDNDDVPDEFDDMPLDPNETMDSDKDGIGNVADTDDDNDTLSDSEEENLKTDPLDTDTDDDGIDDASDVFPLDPDEWEDTDNDKIGNNLDTDDDNDGKPDHQDKFPLNKSPIIKLKDENLKIGLLEKHTFDASPSYDDDGNIVSYLWTTEEGNQKEGTSVTHTFDRTGAQTIKLTIIDDNGESITKEFQVSVVNNRLYIQLSIFLLTILLALAIFFKYIAEAKNPKEQKK